MFNNNDSEQFLGLGLLSKATESRSLNKVVTPVRQENNKDMPVFSSSPSLPNTPVKANNQAAVSFTTPSMKGVKLDFENEYDFGCGHQSQMYTGDTHYMRESVDECRQEDTSTITSEKDKLMEEKGKISAMAARARRL